MGSLSVQGCVGEEVRVYKGMLVRKCEFKRVCLYVGLYEQCEDVSVRNESATKKNTSV